MMTQMEILVEQIFHSETMTARCSLPLQVTATTASAFTIIPVVAALLIFIASSSNRAHRITIL